jgi:hypothetical protein
LPPFPKRQDARHWSEIQSSQAPVNPPADAGPNLGNFSFSKVPCFANGFYPRHKGTFSLQSPQVFPGDAAENFCISNMFGVFSK